LLGGVVVSLVKTRGEKTVDGTELEQLTDGKGKVGKKEEDPQMRV